MVAYYLVVILHVTAVLNVSSSTAAIFALPKSTDHLDWSTGSFNNS